MKHPILLILLIFVGAKVFAQPQNNLRTKILQVDSDTIQLDSMLILPETVKVFYQGKQVDKAWYQIKAGSGQFIPLQQLKTHEGKVEIIYRIYPYNVLQPIYSRDLSQLNLSGDSKPRTFVLGKPQKAVNPFANSQLNKQGNYSRGISYGNNQDVVVNSNLNLQLSGKLTDEVSILAAISDNNIPVQPDGNTQTIQDFDRIYIQLFDETKELTLGDYEIEPSAGKYMRFYKKVQGGKFSGLVAKGKKKGNELKTTISASIAKGKFNRMEIQGAEGVQGPYRLTGTNNETFIVVLAGSEKVFVDGKPLVRGEKNDYVINYNTAELSFTTNQPITRNSRIVIEFEYSEENYSRYLVYNSNELKTKKGKIWFNFYHEQDSKNKPIDQSLSNENKQLLSEIGDNPELGRVPNVEVVEFSNDFVLYRRVSKMIDGKEFEVYEYSTNPDSAIYRVNFSLVGDNNGNYLQLNNVANGRAYQWVDPVNGVPQGNYEPVVQLTAPQKQQMISVGGDFNLTQNLNTRFEVALSNRDMNTLSSIDDGDNQGIAMDFSVQKKSTFTDTLKQLQTKFTFHHIRKNFEEIGPFRSVEFERDWNIAPEQIGLDENFYSLSNVFANQKWGNTGYDFSVLKRESGYQGLKHGVNLNYNKNRLSVLFVGNSLSADQNDTESKFYRHQMNASYSLGFAKIGVKTENENNQWEAKDSKALLANSFAHHSYQFYMANIDSTNNQFSAYYKKRKDFLPRESNLRAQSESQDFGAGIWLKKNSKNQLKIESVYRKLSILDNTYTDEEPENTFLGKLEHQARIGKGLLQASTYYELGSGLESEKEFLYVEVNDGQGTYRWTDYNGNDVKELDEFEIANFKDEANYIRVATNTNNYQKVYTNEFRQTFYLRLRRLKPKNKFGTFFVRFNNRFAYRISKKSLKDDFNLYGNPFNTHEENENLITISSSFQNTLSYQKAKSKTSWDLIHLSSNSKQLLTQGFERRKFKKNGLRFKWKIGNSSQLNNRFDLGKKSLQNESFTNKDYNLNEVKNELKLKFQPTITFQFGLSYAFSQKKNKLAAEKSTNHNIGADCQYAIAKTGKLMASINFLKLSYNDNSSTSVAYEMLEGFLPGNNATWNLGYNQQLSKTFQLNLSYNGRQSEGGKTIHVGGMEVRAYF